MRNISSGTKRLIGGAIITAAIGGAVAVSNSAPASTPRVIQPGLTPFGTRGDCPALPCGNPVITLSPFSPFTPYPTRTNLPVPTLPATATVHPTITRIGGPTVPPTPSSVATATPIPIPPTRTRPATTTPPATLTPRPSPTSGFFTPTPDIGGGTVTRTPFPATPTPALAPCSSAWSVPSGVLDGSSYLVTFRDPIAYTFVNIAVAPSGQFGVYQSVSFASGQYNWVFLIPGAPAPGLYTLTFTQGPGNTPVAPSCTIQILSSVPATPIPIRTPTFTPSPTLTPTPAGPAFTCTAGMVLTSNPLAGTSGVVQFTTALPIGSPVLIMTGHPVGYVITYGGVSGAFTYTWVLSGLQPVPVNIYVANGSLADIRGFCSGTIVP